MLKKFFKGLQVSPAEKTKAFLEIAPQFKLGHLVTESFHPKTLHLSQLVKTDISDAFKLLQEIDLEALRILSSKNDLIWELFLSIKDTLNAGNKIFLCGCGATGRLSLVLETLFRQKFSDKNLVFSFMAGGDFALIKSVESFEDNTHYGEVQLMEMGFGPNDLLLASSEGGETPFVIGAVQKASLSSSRKPYFLYCNPDEVLLPIKRSRDVIVNPGIKKINLTVGPMAISGSTRMQASTVLMLAIGLALLYEHNSLEEFNLFYQKFLEKLSLTNYQELIPFTNLEARLYEEGKFLNYVTDSNLGISILTDTTERSPTFSLSGFENRFDENPHHALSYLFLPDTKTSDEAWNKLLWRSPRPIDWPELKGRINKERLLGFDISQIGLSKRKSSIPTKDFLITYKEGRVYFKCDLHETFFDWGEDYLFNHLMIKMLLNAHSTLIMGLMGRYEGNVMTWVRASNNKLIDRAARYTLQVLKQKNKTPSYEDVVLKIFEQIENLEENEAIVMKVVDQF